MIHAPRGVRRESQAQATDGHIQGEDLRANGDRLAKETSIDDVGHLQRTSRDGLAANVSAASSKNDSSTKPVSSARGSFRRAALKAPRHGFGASTIAISGRAATFIGCVFVGSLDCHVPKSRTNSPAIMSVGCSIVSVRATALAKRAVFGLSRKVTTPPPASNFLDEARKLVGPCGGWCICDALRFGRCDAVARIVDESGWPRGANKANCGRR